jgi:thiol-disulfide isomerase/thioredoxin
MDYLKNVRAHHIAFLAIVLFVIQGLLIINLYAIPPATARNTVSLYYFYSEDCPHCKEVTPQIEALEAVYPEIDVHKHEVSYNSTNSELFNAFIQAYDPPAVDIPAAFIGTTSLIGSELTKERLEAEIAYCLQNECSDPRSLIAEQDEEQHPGLFILIGKALIEGINPCGFAVLIVLLASLFMVKSKRSVLIVGLTFIASVFVTHLAIGYGLMEIFQRSGVPDIMRSIVIVIVITAGIINIWDFWREKSSLAIPAFIKPTLGKLARYASIPSAVLLGFLSTIAGFPCTGWIYLTQLASIANVPSKMVFYLVVYNVFYILPLLVILYVVYQKTSPEDVEAWRKGKRKYMKLIAGVVMVAIGVAMLFGVI